MIKDNLKEIFEKIKACEKSSPYSQEVKLIAVTKTRSIEEIRQVIDYGIYDLGENRVSEMLEKQSILTDEKIRWHLIGHLQRKKVKQIIAKTYLIHSVDSLSLMEEIQKQSLRENIVTDILLEINIGQEESKYGFGSEEIFDALESASQLPNIRVRGLMCMAPFTDDFELIEKLFSKMHKIYEKCSKMYTEYGNIKMEVLSMGMSNDFEKAILCGSNTLRIGTTIFKGESNGN